MLPKQVFGSTGTLQLHLKGFEERQEQTAMAECVHRAFVDEKVALIEAGTGIGKSLAYLIPAISWACREGETIVISTNTIALQEQLIQKDIPLALRVLDVELKVVLAKGMGNYVCLRKLHGFQDEQSLFGEENEGVRRIASWARSTVVGSKAELPFAVPRVMWQQVAAESNACSYMQCPHFTNCFFFKARSETESARIIVVNHHLLFADIASRKNRENFSTTAVLPPYHRVIIDEAHHIEDIATAHFAERCSRNELVSVLHELTVEISEKKQKGFLLHQRLIQRLGAGHRLTSLIGADLRAMRSEVLSGAHILFAEIAFFCSHFPAQQEEMAVKIRLKKEHYAHSIWLERVAPAMQLLAKQLQDLALFIEKVDKEIGECKDGSIAEDTKNIRMDMQTIVKRLQAAAVVLFRMVTIEENIVHWIEQQTKGDILLVVAEHNVGALLKKYLFDNLKTTILCSATLTANNQFSYIRSRIGLEEALLEERIYASPFEYKKNVLLCVATDMPLPDHSNFSKTLDRSVQSCIQASRGNAFVLFTSYGALKQCYDSIAPVLVEQGYFPLKQGDEQRQILIQRFKEKPRSVLFGTDSFWEGVDVPGDALRCVIITKLPFHVPTDPIAEARCEMLFREEKNPFIHYAVPRAIVKFKQAFGRLIRTKSDRGCVVCLDIRIITKSYGKFFIQSLPECMQAFDPLEHLTGKMRLFYGNKSSIKIT